MIAAIAFQTCWSFAAVTQQDDRAVCGGRSNAGDFATAQARPQPTIRYTLPVLLQNPSRVVLAALAFVVIVARCGAAQPVAEPPAAPGASEATVKLQQAAMNGQLDQIAAAIAQERGLRLPAELSRRIVELTAGDRALMAGEIEKLALFLDAAPEHPATATAEALDALSAEAVDADTGPLVNAVIGGMSGVLYGVFGFVWMQARFNRRYRYVLEESTTWLMMIWFVLCLTGLVGPIANVAHAGGLIAGLIAGVPAYVGYLRGRAANAEFGKHSWADVHIRGKTRVYRQFVAPYVPLWLLVIAAVGIALD